MKSLPLSEVVILVPSTLANLNSSFSFFNQIHISGSNTYTMDYREPFFFLKRKEKPERRIRSIGNQKAKTISNFIHWCGLQSSVIGFLKFQCAVKCRFSLIMLVCLYYKAPWFGLRL
ncbi:hypothetical protein V6Z12_D09G138700 [Gossypium hirsutum]